MSSLEPILININKVIRLKMDINKILHQEIVSFTSHDIRDKNIVLTGEMSLSRREMTLLIESVGGRVKTSVTATTDILVTPAEQDWRLPSRLSNKIIAASRRNIRTISDELMIHNVNVLKSALKSCAVKYIKNDVIHLEAWCTEFPFLINNWFSWDVSKKIIFENLSLFKFIDQLRYLDDSKIVLEVVSKDGSLFEYIPESKKKNLSIVQAAMFAEKNPKIHLCKKLLGIQIKHLDLKHASLADREYIWKAYLNKAKLEDVLIIAKERELFLQNTNSN